MTTYDYEIKREEARQEAIDWQNSESYCNCSYGELYEYQQYFRKLGEKYNLLDEFRENCICKSRRSTYFPSCFSLGLWYNQISQR